jgi:hypothetical protein
MSDTKARPGSGNARGGQPLGELPELQVRISCGGKGAAQALEELRLGLSNAESAGRDPLVVLEELGRLEDSVVTFIKGLSRMLVGYPRAVTFWESSGYSEAFLSVMEQPWRTAAC